VAGVVEEIGLMRACNLLAGVRNKWIGLRAQFLAVLVCFPVSLAAADAALEIAVFPYLSTRAVIELYNPIQEHLEKRLHRPVLFVTAPDMRTFVERTQRGEYRFVLTAPHFARLAQREAGYKPLLRVKAELQGLLVVDKDSPFRRIGDLRGQTVVTPDRLAIAATLGIQMLRASGLKPGENVTLQTSSSHNSAVLSVQKKESAAAITATGALQQMPLELRSSVRILGKSDGVPNIMYLAHPGVPLAEVMRVRDALLDFADNTPEGRAFMDSTGFVGWRSPTAKEMSRLDPYANDVKDMLRKAR